MTNVDDPGKTHSGLGTDDAPPTPGAGQWSGSEAFRDLKTLDDVVRVCAAAPLLCGRCDAGERMHLRRMYRQLDYGGAWFTCPACGAYKVLDFRMTNKGINVIWDSYEDQKTSYGPQERYE